MRRILLLLIPFLLAVGGITALPANAGTPVDNTTVADGHTLLLEVSSRVESGHVSMVRSGWDMHATVGAGVHARIRLRDDKRHPIDVRRPITVAKRLEIWIPRGMTATVAEVAPRDGSIVAAYVIRAVAPGEGDTTEPTAPTPEPTAPTPEPTAPTTTPPTTAPPTTTTTPPPTTTTPPTTTPTTTEPATEAPVTGTLGRAAYSQLSFYPGFGTNGRDKLESLESWLRRDVGTVVQFGGKASPSDLTGSAWGVTQKAGSFGEISESTSLSLTVPLAFGSATARTEDGKQTITNSLLQTAGGVHDGTYRRVAEYLVSGGYEDAILRVGHEFDGAWYPWSAVDNCENFKAAFRHVVQVFRGVSPEFRFDYNGTAGPFARMADCAYPGDAYVDIVGLDVYDAGFGKNLNAGVGQGWIDPEKVFDQHLKPMLQFHLDFAKKHGKQVSFPEWALVQGGTKNADNAGADNPVFIRKMYEWFDALPADGGGSLVYHSYFMGANNHSGTHRIDDTAVFPNANTEFRRLFGS